MTFIADGFVCLVILMLGVVAVHPAGTGRRHAPGGTEMALRAFCSQIMTFAAVYGAGAMKFRTLDIKPGLAQGMIDALAMAIMAGLRTKIILPHDGVALVADFRL
jgi:hypothetical protein